MNKIIYVSIIAVAVFLNGCGLRNHVMYSKKHDIKKGFYSQEVETMYINYGKLCDNAVASIFKKTEVPKKVIVTDFVDVTSLDNHTRLGYVLSNNIKNSLINNYEISVVEAEVSKYFKISGNGLKILSREADKLRTTNFDVRYAIAGTYTYTNNELIIFVKLIDLKSGIIKGSYAKTLAMGEGTKLLLSTK
jgi:TolB-like protein